MSTLDPTHALLSYDRNNLESQAKLRVVLDATAKALAADLSGRRELGSKGPYLWLPLEATWKATSDFILAAPEPTQGDIATLMALSRFTRNLVANIGSNQAQAYSRLAPSIQRLIHYFTSFLLLQRNDTIPLVRLLTQTLSNIVTDNEKIASVIWSDLMGDPHDGNIILRLLAVEDTRTIVNCFVLLVNVTKGSMERCTLFVDSKAGQRLASKMLVHIARFMEATEHTLEATASTIGYQFFRQIFDYGMFAVLYDNIGQDEEPILPYQCTLLKLLDGYLQAPTVVFHATYSRAIPRLYSSLVAKTSTSIEASISNSLATPDSHLPSLAEGTTLVAQCVQALLLREHGSEPKARRQMELQKMHETGVIEFTIMVLRSLDILIPRIQLGKPMPSPLSPIRGREGEPDPTAFPYIKRDLIRLLGTLAYGSRTVQDRIRECGGLEVIMGHCVIDERNPYMQEHAVFALRNLLEGNEENQRVVRDIKPLRAFDTEGVLRTLKKPA